MTLRKQHNQDPVQADDLRSSWLFPKGWAPEVLLAANRVLRAMPGNADVKFVCGALESLLGEVIWQRAGLKCLECERRKIVRAAAQKRYRDSRKKA